MENATFAEWQELTELGPRPCPTAGFGRNAVIRARAGLHWIRGNRRPHFSVTADVHVGKRDVAGGCMHEDVAKYFPRLVPVIPLHLSDDDGAPMYAAENGLCWLGFGRYSELNLETAAKHFRITVEEAQSIRERIMSGSGHDAALYAQIIEGMRARWKAEAEAAINTLREIRAMAD